MLEPDLAECEDVDDVVDAMTSEYETALGQAGARPLVVRFRLLGQTPAAGALAAADPERVLAEARSLVRTGSAVDKVVLDVSPPVSSPTLDPELAAQVTDAAQALAGDPDKVREILDDLRKFGLWRLTRDTEIDLDSTRRWCRWFSEQVDASLRTWRPDMRLNPFICSPTAHCRMPRSSWAKA